MSLDLNEAPEQREFGATIPDGTFVKLHATLRPGGNNLVGAEPIDAGLFKQSATSDAVMLDFEFTVMHGPHAKRKVFQIVVIAGGSVDEKGQSKAGNISKAMLRAMVDSAVGLDPKDMSDTAKAKRVLRGFSDFDGIEFAARIGIEKGGASPSGGLYPDKNRIAHVVVPGEPEWQPVMAGQDVAPKPTGGAVSSGSRVAAPQQTARSWQGGAPGTSPQTPTWGNGAGAPANAPVPETAGTGPGWLRG